MTDPTLRQDVADVLLRYATGVDRRDWKLFRTRFTDDCQADYGGIGAWHDADSFTAWMDQAHIGGGRSLHRVTNQDIATHGDGDAATACCYLDAIVMTADDQTAVRTVGYCDDELVRTDDGWKIARRRYTMVHCHTERNLGRPQS